MEQLGTHIDTSSRKTCASECISWETSAVQKSTIFDLGDIDLK